MSQPAQSGATVRVWDPIVRLFHWTVVAGCLLNLFVLEDEPHEIVGYLVASFLVIRVIWGFVGTRHARFSDFVVSPRAVIANLSDILHRREARTLGHTPAGGAMMLALMVLLAGLSVTGILMGTDAFWGVDWVEEAHETMANLLMGLAIVHVLAALYESHRHHENLVWAMVTGRKRRDA